MPVVGSKGEIFGAADGSFNFQPSDLELVQTMIDKDQFIVTINFNTGRADLNCIILSPKKISNDETISEFQTRVLAGFSTITVEKLGGSEETINTVDITSFIELSSFPNSDPLIVKESSFTTQGRILTQVTIEFKEVGCVEVLYVVLDASGNEVVRFPRGVFCVNEPRLLQIPASSLKESENYSKIILRQKYGGGRAVITYLAKSMLT